jgi:hypothetical protein
LIILAFQVVLGLVIGFFEGWSVGDGAISLSLPALQSAMAMSYRDRRWRALAIAIGISGLFLISVIAGIAVYATHVAIGDRDSD